MAEPGCRAASSTPRARTRAGIRQSGPRPRPASACARVVVDAREDDVVAGLEAREVRRAQDSDLGHAGLHRLASDRSRAAPAGRGGRRRQDDRVAVRPCRPSDRHGLLRRGRRRCRLAEPLPARPPDAAGVGRRDRRTPVSAGTPRCRCRPFRIRPHLRRRLRSRRSRRSRRRPARRAGARPAPPTASSDSSRLPVSRDRSAYVPGSRAPHSRQYSWNGSVRPPQRGHGGVASSGGLGAHCPELGERTSVSPEESPATTAVGKPQRGQNSASAGSAC